MRADRLISILMLLQTRGRMTARDLAEQLEVSERTIYRDLEALSMAGIPIYTERGPGGGCSLLDGYQTKLTGLTETEVQALFLLTMAAPLADLGLGKALEEALLKLTASLPASSREQVKQLHQRFLVDATWWHHTADAQVTLQTIQQAIWQNCKLHIVYTQDNEMRCEQIIEPYGLVAKAGVWYLVSADRSSYHVYRVSRIHSATMTGERFIRANDFDLANCWSDYCAWVEHEHPLYAIPLRLAPDEVSTVHQKLHRWGYQLIENNGEVLEEELLHEIKHYQTKKEDNTLPVRSQSRQSSMRRLFVLNQAGEWCSVDQRGKAKNAGRSGQITPSVPSFNAQPGPDGGGSKQKNAVYHPPIKKMPFPRTKARTTFAPLAKNSPRRLIKKTDYRASQKKMLIFLSMPPVCSLLSA
jgi:predicted DNA-binding transcriptional regulator YafY